MPLCDTVEGDTASSGVRGGGGRIEAVICGTRGERWVEKNIGFKGSTLDSSAYYLVLL